MIRVILTLELLSKNEQFAWQQLHFEHLNLQNGTNGIVLYMNFIFNGVLKSSNINSLSKMVLMESCAKISQFFT